MLFGLRHIWCVSGVMGFENETELDLRNVI